MSARHYPAVLLAVLHLAGCGTSSLSLPYFGEPTGQERDRRPANATEYRCDGNRRFYVRSLDAGALWLIAPDREIRLEKLAEGRWGVGRVVLEMSGNDAQLTDPPATFTGCKRAG
jgi:hypothetical protein